MSTFRALLLEEADGKVTPRITELTEDALPAGEVTVAVRYSTLNYKDGLILGGLGRLVRKYPHVPGIDFSGIVERSDADGFNPGDAVLLTGWRVGEVTWGGYAGKARVKAGQLVRLPEGMSLRHAMAIGTAGFTAMLAVMALERQGLQPGDGEVLVTGAAGGVGSVAITLLARLGHSVVASTGRAETHDYLRGLGAKSFVGRNELAAPPERPLEAERWSGAVDAVGGTTLGRVLTQLRYGASVAACGLAGGSDLSATVLPFLLRGVNLLGIDSVMCPIERRLQAWQRLACELPASTLDAITDTAHLADLPELGRRILAGNIRGRVVVEM